MTRIKTTKRVKVSTEGSIQSQVASIIPGKRKPDCGENPVQLDGVSSTLKMKPKYDDDHDDSTVEVDYEVTDEETARHTCCIHCPLLKTYLQLHGEWPPEPATNKEA
jgi:hypothetical protein